MTPWVNAGLARGLEYIFRLKGRSEKVEGKEVGSVNSTLRKKQNKTKLP